MPQSALSTLSTLPTLPAAASLSESLSAILRRFGSLQLYSYSIIIYYGYATTDYATTTKVLQNQFLLLD